MKLIDQDLTKVRHIAYVPVSKHIYPNICKFVWHKLNWRGRLLNVDVFAAVGRRHQETRRQFGRIH